MGRAYLNWDSSLIIRVSGGLISYDAARTVHTGIAEKRFHRSRFLAATNEPPIEMRSYAQFSSPCVKVAITDSSETAGRSAMSSKSGFAPKVISVPESLLLAPVLRPSFPRHPRPRR